MNLELEKQLPDGYELASESPESIVLDGDKSHVIVRYAVKPVKDPHAELKEQYARDVETCATINGLEPWQLWQFNNNFDTGGWQSSTFKPIWSPIQKYRRHQHADSIIAYHKCSLEDKKRWQSQYRNVWVNCDGGPDWDEDCQYRLRPRIISVTLQNGDVIEFPEPVREPLENNREYFIDEFDEDISNYKWINDEQDNLWLKQCRIYLSKSDCIAAHDAIQAILSQRSD